MSAMDGLRALAEAPTVDWVDQLAAHVVGVVEALSKIHGGVYSVDIDEETCFVLIARDDP